ncbi:hypothetical protein PR202_ga29251 [Eleusine coracana subsp. coracana]|uniref:Uncharacterized protein n=1 Tax=Eleusine coracana subsp. coracana TaxID=191504 RepID=A0AAV5DLN1_ELECO|nr:hypothetical protein PR202_ga29251 [Eleusine coracana subsp. coracana]
MKSQDKSRRPQHISVHSTLLHSTPLEKRYISAMAIAETAARKLLHGARGVAAFSFGLDGLWQLIAGFFANIFAGLAHLLALPFEAIWHLLVAAANAVASGLGNLCHLVAGFFPTLFAALAGAAHQLVLPLESLWHWLASAAANAAGSITSGIDSLWRLVTGLLPHLIAALTNAAHDLGPKLESLWRWAQSAAAAAALLLAALVWFFGAAICRAVVAAAASLLPPCAQCLMKCCAVVTMKAPGAAGAVISRAAFEAAPALYCAILRAGGAVVATAVFCAWPVARCLAAPVAFLFRASVAA